MSARCSAALETTSRTSPSSAACRTNTLLAYRRDLARYVGVPRRPAAARSPAEVDRARRRGVPASRSAPGSDGRSRAVGVVGRADRRGGAGLAPVPAAGRRDAARRRQRGAAPGAAEAAAEGDLRRRRRAAARRRRLGDGPAAAARPGAARAALRDRRAHLRGGRPRRRRRRPATPVGAVRLLGKGGKQRIVPVGTFAAGAARRPTSCAAGRRWPRRGTGDAGAVPQHPRRPAVAGRARGRCCGRGRAGRAAGAETCRRTRCGTRSRPTCWTAARTCGWCRSCSGTRR